MSTVTEIIEAVKRLDERAKAEFMEKLAEIDFEDAWDRQIEADAKLGDSILFGRRRSRRSRPDKTA